MKKATFAHGGGMMKQQHPPAPEDDTRYRSTGIVIHLLSEQDLLRLLPHLVPAEAAADILAAILEVEVRQEQHTRRN